MARFGASGSFLARLFGTFKGPSYADSSCSYLSDDKVT